jgi:hypothetical protein
MRGQRRIGGFLFFAFAAASAYKFDRFVPFSVVVDTACLYRDSVLTPPPMAGLSRGEILRIRRPGPVNSLVDAGDGRKGWVRDRDIFWTDTGPSKIRMGSYWVSGWEMIGWTTWINYMISDPPWGLVPLDRNFNVELEE